MSHCPNCGFESCPDLETCEVESKLEIEDQIRKERVFGIQLVTDSSDIEYFGKVAGTLMKQWFGE